MSQLSESVNRKFIDSISLNEWEIETDTGWEPMASINKTVPYRVYQITFTDFLGTVVETIKCADDHIFIQPSGRQVFAKDSFGKTIQSTHGIVKVSLVDDLGYDECMYDVQVDSNNHTYYTNNILSHNTVVAAGCILWYTLFQDRKTVAVLSNKKDGAYEIIDRYQVMFENLPIWMQQGIKKWNVGSVHLENGSKIFAAATTSSGIRGKTINWLYIDEAAIIPNNVAEKFFASAFPTISSGKTTKILMTSTPLGYNHFWKYWNEAKKPKNKGWNGFVPLFIPYWEIPGRDAAWADEQKRRLGPVQYNQEVSCEFLGSSNTLINAETLGSMSSQEPLHTSMHLDVYQEPVIGNTYVLVADTSRGTNGNYSAFSVMDVTTVPYKYVAKYRRNDIAPMLYPTAIHKTAKAYNDAYILVEVNDIGGQIVDILYSEYEYEHIITTVNDGGRVYVSPGFSKNTTLGVRTTKTVKKQGCFAIKSILEEHKMELFDADVIKEFSTFVEKNGSYTADEGYFDDLVMTLVLFGWLTTNQYFTELTDVNVRERLYKEKMAQIEEEMTPFGIIVDGTQEEFEVHSGAVWVDVVE